MSTRPPPPTGAPPPYAFVARVYRRSLRPIVLSGSFFGALWSLLWGISAFSDTGSGNDLRTTNIVLGSLYIPIAVIELFGMYAAFKQNLRLVKLFSYLSIVAVLMVVAAESVRFSTYFTHKNELINNCISDSTGDTVITFGSFWGSGGSESTLTADQAAQYCKGRWNSSVWAAVAWLILATVFGVFLISLAFSYYHQLLNPQSLRQSQAFQLGTFRGGSGSYNPNAGYPYPAPSGPPPQGEEFVPPYDPAKLPEYGGGYSQKGIDEKSRVEGGDSMESVNVAEYGASAARNV